MAASAAQQWHCEVSKRVLYQNWKSDFPATPSRQLSVMQCIHLLPPADIFLLFCLLLLSEWSGLRGGTEAYPCSASVQDLKKKKETHHSCVRKQVEIQKVCNATCKVSLLITLVSPAATNEPSSLPELWDEEEENCRALSSAASAGRFVFGFWRHHTPSARRYKTALCGLSHTHTPAVSTVCKRWVKLKSAAFFFLLPPFHSQRWSLCAAQIHFQTGPDWRLWVQWCDRYVGHWVKRERSPKTASPQESRWFLEHLRCIMSLRGVLHAQLLSLHCAFCCFNNKPTSSPSVDWQLS